MEIKGNFKAYTVQTIPTKNGDKKKGELVIDVPDDNYPYIVAFDIWKEEAMATAATLRPGMSVDVTFNISSREYNGRHYTSAKAWKVEPLSSVGVPAGGSANHSPVMGNSGAASVVGASPYNNPTGPIYDDGNDDLPF